MTPASSCSQTTPPVERVLIALRERGIEPRHCGDGWSSRCPAHDDQNPSLSVGIGDDGRALLKCHAGCSYGAVCTALRLQPADLFCSDESTRGVATGQHIQRFASRSDFSSDDTSSCAQGSDSSTSSRSPRGRRIFPTAREAVAALEEKHGPRSASWTYHNPEGDPVSVIVRWDTSNGKDFRPVSRTADDSGWFVGGMHSPRFLYSLPAILSTLPGSRVYVTEGEKAADAATALGLVATTSAHGCKSAKSTDWSPLSGREVIILPDRDGPGERYAEEVARLTTAAGARSVRVVRLSNLWPEMPEGGDLVDLLEYRGGDVDTLHADIDALVERIDAEADDQDPSDSTGISLYRPFPVDVLPEPLRTFIHQASEAIGCDTTYIALPLLAGLASAIGTTHQIVLKSDWTEPSILWTAIVGESGTAKSPALELALRPVREQQHAAFKMYEMAQDEYSDAMDNYARDLNGWQKSKSEAPAPTEPSKPIASRFWTDDATTESLVVLLKENPRGMLMVRDELAGWFDFDRYKVGKGGGDVAKWLEMFGARPMLVDRKGSGTDYIPRAAVSIAGGIQPKALEKALGVHNIENGLASRLLMAFPPKVCPGWTDKEIAEDIKSAVAGVFNRLYALTPETSEDGDMFPRSVTLTPKGKAAMVDWVNRHARLMEQLDGPVGYAWAKLKGYAARIALVIHLARCAAGDPSVQDPHQADERSISAGVVLANWFGEEARRIYGILNESEENRDTRQLIEWIAKRGGAVTVHDLTHGKRRFRNDKESAERCLTALADAGLGRWEAREPGPKGGRPTRLFRLLPTVTVTETSESLEETMGFGDGDTNSPSTQTGDGEDWGEL